LLPGAALLLGRPLPRAELLRASGVTVAVASDHNPGSSPLFGLLPALQLATPLAGLSVEEALTAGTAHAGRALGRPLWGRLDEGSPADFLVSETTEALLPLYAWGNPSLADVYVAGTRVGP
jgi:imidazolonepropionase